MRTEPPLSLNKAMAAFSKPGARMIVQHTDVGDKFYIMPGGEVSADNAQRILWRMPVERFDDGLFPGNPQSWRIVTG